MKYVLFTLALLGSFPLAAVCSLSKRYLAILVSFIFVVVLKFDGMAINFISYEFYRGTSRGMEVSLAYILSLAVLLSVALSKFIHHQKTTSLFASLGTWLFFAYFVWGVVSAVANDNTFIVNEASIDGRLFTDFLLRGRMLSFFELWKMVMLFIVYCAVYSYVSYVRDATAVIRSLALVVIVCFFIVIKDHFSGVYQVRGPFPHQNSMALFMMLIGCVFFAAYLNLPKSRFRNLCSFAFVCASAALFRTYSRGAIFCYPMAVGFTAVMSLSSRFTSKKIVRIVPLVFVGLIGVAVMLPRIIERFENAPESSGNKRKFFAATALNTVADYPVTGVGINNWAVFLNEHEEYHDTEFGGKDEKGNMGIVETIYLLTATECGWVGLGLLLAWFFCYWGLALKLSFKLARTEWAYIPVGFLGGMSGCYLQSCLEWVLKQQINFMLLMVGFAILSWLNQNWKELVKGK